MSPLKDSDNGWKSKIETRPDAKLTMRVHVSRMAKNGQLRWPGVVLNTHAVRIAQEWLDSEAWGLVLASHPSHPAGTGRGKSLALALLFEYLGDDTRRLLAPGPYGAKRSRKRLCVSAGDLNLLVGVDKAELKEACLEMQDCEALFIDELGAEDDSVLPFLRQVLERRGGAEKLTIMAGSITPSEVQARYGVRFVSRIQGGGLDDHGHPRWVVAVEGDDLRGSTQIPGLPSPEEIAAAKREDEEARQAVRREQAAREEAERQRKRTEAEHARRNTVAAKIRHLRERVRAEGSASGLPYRDFDLWKAHSAFHDDEDALQRWVDAALQPEPREPTLFSFTDGDEIPF